MKPRAGSLLGGLTARRFLRRHWQKRPLVIRGALPRFRDPLSRSSLLELAARPEVESRLVLERGGRRPWQVVPGPQDPARLRRLGGTHWTLLVQEANRHVPALAGLLDLFSFLPRWRVDDVMVSFAPRFGSVGPHVDSYDVFLLQGQGRRRWRIARRFDPTYRQGLDLSVLRRFEPEEEWVLEPGDMLYLPPDVAHHGVALEDCLTYSIGFRAPSRAELVLGYAEEAARRLPPTARYADPDLAPTRHPGALSAEALARLRRLVPPGLAADRDEFAVIAGRLLTRPASPGDAPRPFRPGHLRRRLLRSSGILRSEASRLAYVRRGRRGAVLFVDGAAHELPARLAFAGPLLADRRFLPRADLESALRVPGFEGLLRGFLAVRVFRFVRAEGR